MSKYTLFTGDLNIDISTTLNYDMKELMTRIVERRDHISWEVMGKETRGVVFVSLDETDNTKLTCHASVVSTDYQGETLGPENYLWVMIDKVEAAYRARFITREAASAINQNDFSFVTKPDQDLAQKIEKLAASRYRLGMAQGFLYGCLLSLVVMMTLLTIISFCL